MSTKDIVTAYFEAWTTGDIPTALKYVAPDVVVVGPAGRLDGADAFAQFCGNFAARLTGIRLLSCWPTTRGRCCSTRRPPTPPRRPSPPST